MRVWFKKIYIYTWEDLKKLCVAVNLKPSNITMRTGRDFARSIFLPYVSRIAGFFPLECIYGNYIICFFSAKLKMHWGMWWIKKRNPRETSQRYIDYRIFFNIRKYLHMRNPLLSMCKKERLIEARIFLSSFWMTDAFNFFSLLYNLRSLISW